MIRKQKRGPALFELLQGDRAQRAETLLPPSLRVVQCEPEVHDVEGEQEEAEAERLRPIADVEPSLEAPRMVDFRQGFFELDGDRLRLNLTAVSAAVSVFAICLLALGAFVVGERRGDKAGFLRGYSGSTESIAAGSIDALEAARNQPPATQLVESLLVESPDRGSQIGRTEQRSTAGLVPSLASASKVGELSGRGVAGWVRDHTYIVAQEFSAGREEDARSAQKFLQERGIGAEIIRFDSGTMQLVTTQGFDHKDAAQKKLADGFLKKERAAGAEYFASGGGYRMEGYYKTLKGDRW